MSRFSPPAEKIRRKNILHFLLSVAIGGVGLFLLTFIIFANSLHHTPEDVPVADGIVVFTGTASDRISKGLALLAEKKGKRLLISGVYDDQDFEMLIGLAPDGGTSIRCCVDLDYRSDNTVANTRQTAIWAQVHGYNSLILVTSAHHLPRAYLELRRAMPTIKLSAYPVLPSTVKLQRWWLYPGTTSLLLGEYIRYLWALIGLPRERQTAG